MEIIELMVIMETDMEEEKTKELMCPNRYCYINYRNQKVILHIPKDEEPFCENCGFSLKPWEGDGKVN